ncbi:MAG: metal-sensing transcriptional repressor [Lachnospiraceae bacterium]|nr:metal-sensing transcriptional repressor [Lachnospiraceae bacterium]
MEENCCCGTQTEQESCCCGPKKDRSPEEYKKLVNRLNRIEGQVRGVHRMLDDGAYCVDILTQVSAIQSALSGFSQVLLDDHIKSCVVNDVEAGGTEKIDELITLLRKMMK